jgi:hypothetical protein
MPHWPLLLPPPAVSTSTLPLRSRGSSSSIVVQSPSRRPSSSSCRHVCTVPRHRAVASITLNLPSRRPSPPIAVVLLVHRHRARAVHCHQGAVAPSIAVEEPSRSLLPSPSRSHRAIPRRQGAVAPSIVVAVEEPSRCPLPSMSRRAVPRRRGAVAPSIAIAVDEPSHRPSPLTSRCTLHCRQGAGVPYLAIKEPPSGWLSRLLASHAATSHLPAPPPLIAPSPPLVTPLSGLSSSWLRHRLSSRRRHISAIIESSKQSGFMLI